MSRNHDDHYKRIQEKFGFEPIRVMEAIVCRGIPEEFHEVAIRNLNVAMAVKYQLRLGEKDEATKELGKAQNLLHRAETGAWRPSVKNIDTVKLKAETLEELVEAGFLSKRDQFAYLYGGKPSEPVAEEKKEPKLKLVESSRQGDCSECFYGTGKPEGCRHPSRRSDRGCSWEKHWVEDKG